MEITHTRSGVRHRRPPLARAAGTVVAVAVTMTVVVATALGAGPATAAPGQADDVVLRWNETAVQAIRDVAPAPPVAARALAIMHTAMYDAWTAYDPVAVSTRPAAVARRPAAERTDANRREAVSHAAFRTLADVFPTRAATFEAVLRSLGYDPAAAGAGGVTPAGIGGAAAGAVLEYRHRDGSNQLGDLTPGRAPYSDYTGYVPRNTPDAVPEPDHWQPLRLPNGTVQQFAVPQWGLVTPFALRSGDQLRPPPPPRYGGLEHRAEVTELVQYSARLDDRWKAVAEYWSDGPRSEQPPGHWNAFAQWVSRRDGHDLNEDVLLFFALNNALLDASVAAWDAKRAYDRERPITAVHELRAGRTVRAWAGPYQGTQEIPAEQWRPYFRLDVVTPPFAEYVSGHSTFSAAAATVLTAYTGSDRFGASATVTAGSSLVEPGASPSTDVTLTWSTFDDAAEQAGLSRRYGGIHYRSGDVAGRRLGREVGQAVVSLARAYAAGTVQPSAPQP